MTSKRICSLWAALRQNVHQLHTSHQKGQGKPVWSLCKVQFSLASGGTIHTRSLGKEHVRESAECIKSHSEPSYPRQRVQPFSSSNRQSDKRLDTTEDRSGTPQQLKSFRVCVFPCWISALTPLPLQLLDCQSSSARGAVLHLESPSSQPPYHCLHLAIVKTWGKLPF